MVWLLLLYLSEILNFYKSMKKTVLHFTVFLALLFSVSAYSQVSIGIKAGANLGKVDGVAYKDQFKIRIPVKRACKCEFP